MKVIHSDKKEGLIKLRPETLDDLWYLKGIVEGGDRVKGKGYRRIRDEEKLRPDKGERVPVTLELDVEGVEFHPYISKLRIMGKIVGGPEDLVSMGSHHTLEVQPEDTLTIKKTWKEWHLERLREAEKASKTPLVLIVSIEEGEAEFALVRRYGLDFISTISTTIAGKREEKEHEATAKEFYRAVAEKVSDVKERHHVEGIIIAGPGFAKETLMAKLKDAHPGVAAVSQLESIGSGGKTGVHEVLKRGAVEKVAKESRVSLETTTVERLFVEIAKGSGLAAYGVVEVKNAVAYGAVDKLLVCDTQLRKDSGIDRMMRDVKKTGGDVIIVSTEHEAGERLESMGGIAAILRFRVSG
ncbi:MAG: mRNA surveillance protein pelota [Candidatus Hydrothermarchaeaceae archaeon]